MVVVVVEVVVAVFLVVVVVVVMVVVKLVELMVVVVVVVAVVDLTLVALLAKFEQDDVLWRKTLSWSIIEEFALYERRGLRGRSSRRDLPDDISTRMRVPQHRVPSSERTASSASRLSSNSTKAKPGGLRATQTFRSGPYLPNALSISCFDADEPRLPT